MDYLFGVIPLGDLALWLVGLVSLILLGLAGLAASNPVLLKMALRNIPRRPLQSGLIVAGLLLSTLLITASLIASDSFGYSFKTLRLAQVGNLDEGISKLSTSSANSKVPPTFTQSEVSQLQLSLKPMPEIDEVGGATLSAGAVSDLTTHQTHAQNVVVAAPTNFNAVWGVLKSNKGEPLNFAELGQGEAFIGKRLAKAVAAQPGDKIQLLLDNNQTLELTVRAILEGDIYLTRSGSAPSAGTVVLPLSQYQAVTGQTGVTNLFIKNRGAGGLDDLGPLNQTSQTVVQKLRTTFSQNTNLKEFKDLVSQGAIKTALLNSFNRINNGNPVKLALGNLFAELDKSEVTDEFISLMQDRSIQSQLQTAFAQVNPAGIPDLTRLELGLSQYTIQPIKQDLAEQGENLAAQNTTRTLLPSFFSFLVGGLLIYLIFVMLAAERKAEMGICRAIGLQRRHLAQLFLLEGAAYSLLGGIFGLGLGILVGNLMTVWLSDAFGPMSDGYHFQLYVQWPTLVIAFSFGFILTFGVVSISAYQVSGLNIIAAMRDLENEPKLSTPLSNLVEGLYLIPLAVTRQLGQSRWLSALYLLSLGWAGALGRLLWALSLRGLLTTLIGLALLRWGVQTQSLFLYTLGLGLLIIGTGLLLRWLLPALPLPKANRLSTGRAERLGFTLAGAGLLGYLVQPFGSVEKFLGIYTGLDLANFQNGPEVFLLGSVLAIAGAIWLVIYNSDLVLAGLAFVIGRFTGFAPVARTSLAYPLTFKFRSGVTIAMFALITFAITFLAVFIESNRQGLSQPDKLSAGWELMAGSPSINYNPDQQFPPRVIEQIKANPKLAGEIAAVGSESRQVTSLSQVLDGPNTPLLSLGRHFLRIVDDNYLSAATTPIAPRAEGYDSDRAVWQAIKEQEGLAVIANSAIPAPGPVGSFNLQGLNLDPAGRFKPFEIEVVNPQGERHRLKVIGFTDHSYVYWNGIYTSAQTGHTIWSSQTLTPTGFYFKPREGISAEQLRLDLGEAFSSQGGFETLSTAGEIEEVQQFEVAVLNELVAFMSLGLFIGIAGLGVISSRIVVERRQQIGMLRAIGFTRRMVQASFLLELSFVALSGLFTGTVIGIWWAYRFLNDSFSASKGVAQYPFSIPVVELGLILSGVYLATIFTTYLPARAAARVKPAEALRYE